MNKQKLTIRPSSPVAFFMWALGLLFSLPIIFVSFDLIGKITTDPLYVLFVLACMIFAGIFALIALAVPYKQRIVFDEESFEAVTWKNGKPYIPRKDELKLPKTISYRLPYTAIRFFGVYRAIDIYTQAKQGSQDLDDRIQFGVEDPSLPSQLRNLDQTSDVLILIDDQHQIMLINTDLYSRSQIQWILYELQAATLLPSKGLLEPKQGNNGYMKGILTFLAAILIVIVFPVSSIFLEAWLNPTHTTAYQSLWRHVYVLSSLFGGIGLLGVVVYIRSSQKERLKDEAVYGNVGRFFKWTTIILYTVFLISFTISVLS